MCRGILSVEDEYMTVGELAKRVGITVRAIQYYDQRGLLPPSQIGSSNQRLYAEGDVELLQRILVLKYLGKSLADIKREDGECTQVLREAVEQSLGELDGELLKLMERMSTLKRLEQLLDSGEPRWGSAAQLIERSQHSAQAFWETLVDEDAPEEQGLGRAEVMSWHKLMSDAIELMQSEVPASDQRALELAERFAELGGNERALVGLGKMRSGAASKGCTLYESLQKRTLLYLNVCLDALQEKR